jgi:serine/threonine protein kinase
MDDSTADAAPSSIAPVVVGGERYVLIDQRGRGGTAVVYTAYDRQLDRKIAIKIMHRGGGAQNRLLREAHALAKLRHPNVVTVYDIGKMPDGLFLAMELVEGETLRAWLAAERRGWREILRIFVLAGRGLSAAHAQGLVHRDFKPDNVLIGTDGAVRVADFGLARLSHDSEPEDESEPTSSPSPSALHFDLTDAGAVVGTPRYMSPEQHAASPSMRAAISSRSASRCGRPSIGRGRSLTANARRPGCASRPPGLESPAGSAPRSGEASPRMPRSVGRRWTRSWASSTAIAAGGGGACCRWREPPSWPPRSRSR